MYKPPTGLIPKQIFEDKILIERIKDIDLAFDRYIIKDDQAIHNKNTLGQMIDWAVELEDRLEEYKERLS